ncbi:hypothetical protein [Rubellimicrobium roseum]|uniref:Uncharacterized protein n=1 Tax=Rubellimicrobium roseum TaxID=687525 RepID=A0A5C4NBV2_9RHOB|nr:hypothetical protein [Rubellimicrobium roseum]TNC72183.1 hypothetical protein FHG71_09015 [Rubellimicrobium roseum]
MPDTALLPDRRPPRPEAEPAPPTRSRLVEADAPADRLLAILLEIETAALVQTVTLRAGAAEIVLLAGFGQLLEIVEARIPGRGGRPAHRLRQVAHVLCALIRQPGPMAIEFRRGATGWSRKVQGWGPGELRSVCRRLLAQEEPEAARPAGGADPAAAEAFVAVAAPYCRGVLQLGPEGEVLRGWGEGSALEALGPEIAGDLAGWVAATRRVLPARQFLLLRADPVGMAVGVLVEGGVVTVLVFEARSTGLVSVAAARHLGGTLGA